MSPILKHAFWVISLLGAMGMAQAEPTSALHHAHAHNDYEHARPLFDALDEGFCSVEADVYLVDGQLLVAHDRKNCHPKRTLEALYLRPLLERVRKEGGVYRDVSDFSLWIDIKLDPAIAGKSPTHAEAAATATLKAIDKLLANYASMLTTFTASDVKSNAVTVILTGAHPRILSSTGNVRLACFDSHVLEPVSSELTHFTLAFSENWTHLFAWRGEGEMPKKEEKKLREVVNSAHRIGKRVRFWATPENPAIWQQLSDAKTDWIGTDHLKELAKFMKTHDKQPLTTK